VVDNRWWSLHRQEINLAAIDEPVLGDDASEDGSADEPMVQRIRDLVSTEPFAVLCTQGGGQPYGSVIAFAVSEDMKHAAFCTPRSTRKYRLLVDCAKVALVIDNRSRHHEKLRQVEAVTITGRATELPSGGEHDLWRDRLMTGHPYMQEFLDSPSCALFRVDLVRYLHVWRFQEVRQWIPGKDV
jgi:nitroimidazol reductase NimA-like FMN-containing flavoprotein (pyridoxamine 5'-phosphate oxidase superfamily)